MKLKYILAAKWSGWVYGCTVVEKISEDSILLYYASGKTIERYAPAYSSDIVGTVISKLEFDKACAELDANPYSAELIEPSVPLTADAIFNYVEHTNNMQELIQRCVVALAARDALIDVQRSFMDIADKRLKRGMKPKRKTGSGSVVDAIVQEVCSRSRGYAWPCKKGVPDVLTQQDNGFITTSDGKNAFGRRFKLAEPNARSCTVVEVCAALCDIHLAKGEGIVELRAGKFKEIDRLASDCTPFAMPELPPRFAGLVPHNALTLLVLRARLAGSMGEDVQGVYESLLDAFEEGGWLEDPEAELTAQQQYLNKVNNLKDATIKEELTDEQIMDMLNNGTLFGEAEDAPQEVQIAHVGTETPARAWAAPTQAQRTQVPSSTPVQGRGQITQHSAPQHAQQGISEASSDFVARMNFNVAQALVREVNKSK